MSKALAPVPQQTHPPLLGKAPLVEDFKGSGADVSQNLFNLEWWLFFHDLREFIANNTGGDTGVTINDIPIPGASESNSNFKGDNLNVRMFGAKLDGVTDDTVALAAGILYCSANSITLTIPSGVLIASVVYLLSGLMMVGRPGATIKQKNGSAVNSTPFIINSDTVGGNSDIEIEGITFDENKANQTATNVDTCDLLNVSNVVFRNCKFLNAVRAHIFGQLIAGITIEDCYFENWATGNVGAVYLASRASNNFGGPGGAISKIRITRGTYNGWTSHSSCIKIDGESAHLCTDIQIEGAYVYPGDTASADTLGIELFAGSAPGFKQFGILGCHVIGENSNNTRIFGISLGGFGGLYGSVIGNNLTNCCAFGIEVIASFVDVLGNESYNCGNWTIDAGATSLTAVNLSHNKINEPTKVGSYRNAIHAIAHAISGGPWDIDGLTLIGNECRSTASADINLIIIENQTAGLVKNITVAHNTVCGLNNSAGSGISIVSSGGTLVDYITIESNFCINLAIGINNAGTHGRYLWNRFHTVATQYGNAFVATDMLVEIENALGHFSPQSLRIVGITNPVLLANGDVSIPTETLGFTNAQNSPTLPNVWTWNGVNFGTNLQGGILSVNSRWNGNPNWIKTSTNAYNRAMFCIFGAKRFLIGFGPAASANGSTPYDVAPFFVMEDDTAGPSGLPAGVYITGSLFLSGTGASVKFGAGSPEGVVTATVGSLYSDTTNGELYEKATGSGNTGWDQFHRDYWTPVVGDPTAIRSLFRVGIGGSPPAGPQAYVAGDALVTGDVTINGLTASSPVKTNASKKLISGTIDGTSATEFSCAGISGGHFIASDGTKLIDGGVQGLTGTVDTALTPKIDFVNGVAILAHA